MFVLGKYSLASLYFPTIVGLSIVCVLFFTFGFQFLKWRRDIKQSLGILLFAFSFLLLGVVQLIDLPYLSLTMSQNPKIVTPTSEIIPPLDIQDKLLIFLIDRSVYVDYAAFALMLFGPALLLWQYSRRINKLLLWVLIAIPLAGYAGADIEAFHISQLDLYTQGDGFLIFLSFVGIFSWLSHSFAFFYVARRVPAGSIRIFLNIDSYRVYSFQPFLYHRCIGRVISTLRRKFFFIVSNFSIYGAFWYLWCRTISIPRYSVKKTHTITRQRGPKSVI